MKKMLFYVAIGVCVVLFPLTLYWVFFKAELQKFPLFFNQKIFYYHVGFATLMFVTVFICGIASAVYLKTRRPGADDIAAAAGYVGVCFGLVVLTTGAIWAKVAWGAWWVWEARLTMSLLLVLTLVGYNLVRAYGGPGSENLAGGLGVFAMAAVPLVYFSVNIWKGGQHPTQSTNASLQGDMRVAFLLCLLLFGAFLGAFVAVRARLARLQRSVHELREQALDAGIL